jgi:hypothetical protein
VVPPTIEALAPLEALAGPARASDESSAQRAPQIIRCPPLRTRLIAPLSAAFPKSITLN